MLAAQRQTGFFGVRIQAPAPCVCPARAPLTIEAAHKKGGGSTKNGRDSNGQRRGVKVYGGQPVKAGGIIVRQVGCKFHPGPGVKAAVDWSLYATHGGIVMFKTPTSQKYRSLVYVVPEEEYQPPADNITQPDSRRSRRKDFFSTNGNATGKRTSYDKSALKQALAK